LKKDYKDFKYLKDNSGFGWDAEKMIPTAPEEVWKDLIAVSIPLYTHHSFSEIACIEEQKP
jgi:hypothetical protein